MIERDWQKDWKLCQEILRVVKDEKFWWSPDPLLRAYRYLEQALEGWPAALEERARLEERVRELEAECELLGKYVNAIRRGETAEDFWRWAQAYQDRSTEGMDTSA